MSIEIHSPLCCKKKGPWQQICLRSQNVFIQYYSDNQGSHAGGPENVGPPPKLNFFFEIKNVLHSSFTFHSGSFITKKCVSGQDFFIL